MLTFQILDGGETFYRTLEGRSLAIGSDPDADIRLTEEGVAPHHARIELVTGKARGDSYKLIDLDTEEGTLVNGEPIVQVRLRLGDRIEIGRAVLVLGQRVSRRATAADVVEESQSARARRVRRRPKPPSRSRPTIAIAVGALFAAAGVAWLLGADDKPPAAYAELTVLREAGRFDEADRLLKRLRRDWAGLNSERGALLDGARSKLTETASATTELRTRMAREAPTRSFGAQVDELKALEKAPPSASAEAARILRREIIGLRRTAIAAHEEALAQRPRAPQPTTPRPGTPSPEQPTPGESAAERELAAVLASVDDADAAGQFAQALEILRQAMATTPAEHADALRDRMAAQRQRTRDAMTPLVDEARTTAGAGDLDGALATLRGHAPQFPTTGSLAAVTREIESLEAQIDARRARDERTRAAQKKPRSAPEDPRAGQTRRSSLGLVADLLQQSRDAEKNGDFAAAETHLSTASDRVREHDTVLADRLAGQARDLHHLAALTAMVGTRLSDGRQAKVALRRGGIGQIHGVREHSLQVETADGMHDLGWPDLPAQGVSELVDELGGGPPALLGTAVLAYRNGEAELAESCLVRALSQDSSLESEIWGVLRRGRMEAPDPDGYQLVDGQFVAMRVIEAKKLAVELQRRVATALRGDTAAREQLVEELLAQGPRAVEALVVALGRTQERLAGELAEHTFKKKVYDRLAEQREQLDEARRHAVELIYDEQRYFYPYKPPAVSAERAAEYGPVQREVDERVATVRELWEGRAAKGRIPTSVRQDLERLRWVTGVMAELSEHNPEVEQRAGWAFTLPDQAELDLHNFCKSTEERDAWELYQRIEVFNRALTADLPDAESRQIEVTNAYRRMFGHRPLAVNLAMQEAARGHCQEMSKLGFFGHFSPTPGRRTPFDRMKLAGYKFGASENCAINGSAQGAHDAWLHSAGHHRNLLAPSHKEFGSANDGRYWTQNFGRGEDYLANERFPK